MKPSTRIVMRAFAAARNAPAIIAISKPPNVASVSIGSALLACTFERGREHIALVAHAFVRQVRATPDAHVDRQCAQPAHQARRRRGIRDAHLAEADHVGPERRVMTHARAPRSMACKRFVARHRGFVREVARAAAPDRDVDQPSDAGERRRDTRVDHFERHAGRTRQRIDRRPARQEIRDHLHGHFLRIRTHALGRDAMIAREHDHRGAFDARLRRPLDQADLQRERFEPAETAGRLRLRIDDVLELGLQRAVERLRASRE